MSRAAFPGLDEAVLDMSESLHLQALRPMVTGASDGALWRIRPQRAGTSARDPQPVDAAVDGAGEPYGSAVPAEADAATRLTFFAGPAFFRTFVAATVARVADEGLALALVLFVLARTGDAFAAGACVAAATFPGVVSGPLLGHVLDRSPRRKRLMVTNQLVVALSLAAVWIAIGRIPPLALALLVIPAGLTNPLITGGFTSLIPLVVAPPDLPRANSLESVSYSTAGILGPAIAGFVASEAGTTAAVAFVVATALCALPLMLAAPIRPGAAAEEDEPLGGSFAATAHEIGRDRRLLAITIGTTVAVGGRGLLAVGFPRYATDLGVNAGAAGYFFAAFGVSSIIGALVTARLIARRPVAGAVAGLAWLGAAMLMWVVAPTVAVALVLISIAGVADGPVSSAMFGARQRWSRPQFYARVATSAASLRTSTFAVGSLIGGAVTGAAGAKTAIAVAASVQLAAAATTAAIARRG
jgi:MFS family permease